MQDARAAPEGLPRLISIGFDGRPGRVRLVEYGACDLSFEVVQMDTGQVVRPAPGVVVCTTQLPSVDVTPGRTGNVLGFGWGGRGTDGQPPPPGTYLLRAALGNGAGVIRPPDLRVKLTP